MNRFAVEAELAALIKHTGQFDKDHYGTPASQAAELIDEAEAELNRP